MTKNVMEELYNGVFQDDPRRLAFTRKASGLLPPMSQPRILDIGCGRGGPTMELARLFDGHITGLDTNQAALDELERRAEEAGLSTRVDTVNASMKDIPFDEGTFDIIWTEGVIFQMGFERGLGEWKRFVKPGGYLVIHEMCWLRPDPPEELARFWKGFFPGIATVEENIETIEAQGIGVIDHFSLPDNTWREIYFKPLEENIHRLREKYTDDPEAISLIDRESRYIELDRKYPGWYGSAFYLIARTN